MFNTAQDENPPLVVRVMAMWLQVPASLRVVRGDEQAREAKGKYVTLMSAVCCSNLVTQTRTFGNNLVDPEKLKEHLSMQLFRFTCSCRLLQVFAPRCRARGGCRWLGLALPSLLLLPPAGTVSSPAWNKALFWQLRQLQQLLRLHK